jgi:GTP-binding protein EngB required for normal cell division
MLYKVYRLYHKLSNTTIYVGKTYKELQDRLSQHRHNQSGYMMKNYVRCNGKLSFDIELLENDIPLLIIDERETHWINELKPMFNVSKTKIAKIKVQF